jgi:hypothetical protein
MLRELTNRQDLWHRMTPLGSSAAEDEPSSDWKVKRRNLF